MVSLACVFTAMRSRSSIITHPATVQAAIRCKEHWYGGDAEVVDVFSATSPPARTLCRRALLSLLGRWRELNELLNL